ncbi:energy-coupling factor ABC transporter ATP-binding protein [Nocardiopsis aegyptia]|uniref:ABC transporter ATP-binding protein n=1 Tax=Nocardiopsis aegyptia TaxID=220378 RepID=A0A7Z0EJ78_9ACTN|nr:ABC transporter ATP-binding protein [Nocardiopsis aegyptia]NYJ32586.1 cobalt/nickel transport system ATP-binding protein [Nocardiopsis aegyptia]
MRARPPGPDRPAATSTEHAPPGSGAPPTPTDPPTEPAPPTPPAPPAEPAPLVLAGTGLHYEYEGTGPALTGVDVGVGRGGLLAVLGPNGGGKTTLLRLLAGSLAPTRGSVLLDGAPVARGRRARDRLRRRVQMVFQDPDDQLFSATVGQDVSFGPLNLDLPADHVRARVDWALGALGITALADRPTHLLSYGQRKRVVLAGAMAMLPDVLVLDEPTAGLDPAGVAELVATLDALRARGTTLIVSTHDVDLVHGWAEHALVLDRTVLASGPAGEVLGDSDLLARARLRPAWGPLVGRVLRAHGLLPADAADPASSEELARLLGT